MSKPINVVVPKVGELWFAWQTRKYYLVTWVCAYRLREHKNEKWKDEWEFKFKLLNAKYVQDDIYTMSEWHETFRKVDHD